MTHLDLFSGIGGFALAARWLGIETKAFCEIDSYARKVLTKNFPKIPIHEDVRKLDGKQYRGIDLITGGYPCQPFSGAGKRKGAEDDRHLWPEVRRIIQEARPTWVLCENVAGHITLGLDEVLTELESDGYAAQTLNLPACSVGLWHKRERVWIVANDESEHLQESEVVGKGKIISKPRGTSDETRLRVARWEADQPSMVGMAHGLSNWVDRSRGLGNAIVPQVAYEIMRAIILSTEQ